MPSGSVDGLSESLALRLAAAQNVAPILLFAILGALILGGPAFVVMRLYMRAVFRESRRHVSPSQGAREEEITQPARVMPVAPLEFTTDLHEPSRTEAAHTPTFRHAAFAFRRAAWTCFLAGLLFAVSAVGLLFEAGRVTLPSTSSHLTVWGFYASTFWSWCLLLTIALALFWGPDRRFRVLLLTVYALFFPAAGALLQLAGAPALNFSDIGVPSNQEAFLLSMASAAVGHPVAPTSVVYSPLSQPILFWGLNANAGFFVFLAFNRSVRGTVGPLFVNLALFIVLAVVILNDVAIASPFPAWLMRHFHSMPATLAIMTLLSLAVAAFAGWSGVKWIAVRYHRKRSSDQTFLLDSLWLLAS